MNREGKIKGVKKFVNSLAYRAFKIGKRKAIAHLDKVDNEELRMAGTYALEVADDVVHILTDDNPANRLQMADYLKSPENRQKVLDMSLSGLKGIAIERFEGEKLETVLEIIGLLAIDLVDEEVDKISPPPVA